MAVRFINGHLSQRGAIQGLAQPAALRPIVDVDKHVADQRLGGGLVMTDRLADKLGLRAGQTVRVEVLEGQQRTVALPLTAVVREMMGLNAYMERRALNRLLQEGDLSTQFALAIERGREGELLEASKQMPRVIGAFSKATVLRNIRRSAPATSAS